MPRIPPEGTTPNGDPEELLKRHVREGEAIFKGWSRELLDAVRGLSDSGNIQKALSDAGERLDVQPLVNSLERQDLRGQMLGAADADWEAVNLEIVSPAKFERGISGVGRHIRTGGRKTDMWRGHAISLVTPDTWAYSDGVPVRDDPARACGYCGSHSTPEGHDGCIGAIPGAMNACCGHGVEAEAYVQLGDGKVISGRGALVMASAWSRIIPCQLSGFTQKPFGAAVADFLRKQIVSKPVFERMVGEAKRRAFTVAGAARQLMLQEVFEELAAALAAGEDLRAFQLRLKGRLELLGWLKPGPKKGLPKPGTPSHVEVIYRNNIHGSYARGRDKQMRQPAVVAARPYWQVVTLRADGKTRPTHAAAHGKILRWDDAFWTRAPLPWGHRCLVPGTLVQGRFIGGSRAWYSGPVVTLTTKGGRVLRVTARHPVRQQDAMVPAEQLRAGDVVLCYVDARGEPAEALFQRLLGDDEPVAAVLCPKDFHSEAACFAGLGSELVGSYAGAALKAGKARRRTLSHDAKDHRVGADDALISGMAGNLRIPLPVKLQAGDPFEPDEVTSVEAEPYDGYVYDFETTTGWIVADGVFTSNCRCRKVSRSAADVQRLGLTVSTGADMPRLPDPGWS